MTYAVSPILRRESVTVVTGHCAVKKQRIVAGPWIVLLSKSEVVKK